MKQMSSNDLKSCLFLRPLWQYFFTEPAVWLFLCFFQPARFNREYERQKFTKRIFFMFRLFLLLFFCSFFLALPIQLLMFHCLLCTVNLTTFSTFTNSFFVIVRSATLGIALGLGVGILEDLGLGIVFSIGLGIIGIIGGRVDVSIGSIEAVLIGLLAGSIKGQVWGIKIGIGGCFVAAFTWCITSTLAAGKIDSSILNNFVLLASIFFMAYIISYYRLPLYPVSAFSALRTHQHSKKNPTLVFVYLRKSSLHWDELTFLPLPFLRQTILLAEKQNRPAALKEIKFIIRSRSRQSTAAFAALREIALHDMNLHENIYDISIAASQLEKLKILERNDVISKEWTDPFSHLRDASREATSYYYTSNNRSLRLRALKNMLVYLDKIYPAFPEEELNDLLKDIIRKWKQIAKSEQEKIKEEAETIGQMENPYKPNRILELDDPLFVGRRDIVRQLSESLRRESHRTMFILNGERRMGKTSTLKQLPRLLGASYIPIFYDLQLPSLYPSIDKFLDAIYEEIHQSLLINGIENEKPDQKQLSEALLFNEANIYNVFDKWLDTLDIILEREERTIFLLFDEFEKLQETGNQFLKLDLLLDWFRSTIQNPRRSRIAILFSGVRLFEEMGPNWAGYFVNSKRLKVTFLDPIDATHLILSPTPDFRGKDIFAEDVVEAILHITGRHPFLVQALCSELIGLLNNEILEKAQTQHVTTAAGLVMESYEGYFRDLWDRSTDLYQQKCLKILCQGDSSIDTIVRKTELSEQNIHLALQTLYKRDLILQKQNTYRISMPIVRLWIEQNA